MCNILKKHGNQEGIQAITFSGYLPNFKSIWHFEEKLPQLLASISIELCWFHLEKGQAERQGPWASCFFHSWLITLCALVYSTPVRDIKVCIWVARLLDIAMPQAQIWWCKWARHVTSIVTYAQAWLLFVLLGFAIGQEPWILPFNVIQGNLFMHMWIPHTYDFNSY